MDNMTASQTLIFELLELSITDPIVARETADQFIWDAIRLVGTQTAVAKKIGLSKEVVRYNANHAKKVAFEPMYKILKLLHAESVHITRR